MDISVGAGALRLKYGSTVCCTRSCDAKNTAGDGEIAVMVRLLASSGEWAGWATKLVAGNKLRYLLRQMRGGGAGHWTDDVDGGKLSQAARVLLEGYCAFGKNFL